MREQTRPTPIGGLGIGPPQAGSAEQCDCHHGQPEDEETNACDAHTRSTVSTGSERRLSMRSALRRSGRETQHEPAPSRHR